MFRKMCDCEESVTPSETEQFVFVFTIFFKLKKQDRSKTLLLTVKTH